MLNIQNVDFKKVEALCSHVTGGGEWTRYPLQSCFVPREALRCLSVRVGVQGERDTCVSVWGHEFNFQNVC